MLMPNLSCIYIFIIDQICLFNNNWFFSYYQGLVPSRLTRENLIKELEKWEINLNYNENKEQLINLLET